METFRYPVQIFVLLLLFVSNVLSAPSTVDSSIINGITESASISPELVTDTANQSVDTTMVSTDSVSASDNSSNESGSIDAKSNASESVDSGTEASADFANELEKDSKRMDSVTDMESTEMTPLQTTTPSDMAMAVTDKESNEEDVSINSGAETTTSGLSMTTLDDVQTTAFPSTESSHVSPGVEYKSSFVEYSASNEDVAVPGNENASEHSEQASPVTDQPSVMTSALEESTATDGQQETTTMVPEVPSTRAEVTTTTPEGETTMKDLVEGTEKVAMKVDSAEDAEKDSATDIPDNSLTSTHEVPSVKPDGNRLDNSLYPHVTSTESVVMDEHTTTEETRRKQKQLDLAETSSKSCSCEDGRAHSDLSDCLGQRIVSDPSCPCRNICARQAHQPCNESMPCDKDFGLHCIPETGICQGDLDVKIFDVTHNSARIRWGLEKSELHPQAAVAYSTAYRGPHTQWTEMEPSKPVTVFENLVPNKIYYVKVEEDGKQEISVFQTSENVVGNLPKLLVTQVSPSAITVVWDDFRLPSHHSEYVLEYQLEDNGTDDNWMKVQAGSQTIVTVMQLKPNTSYRVRVSVWEDGNKKLERPSEVVTVRTKDGCVKNNRTYNVGDEFFHGCDLRCICQGGDRETCSPRCNAPYIKVGSKPDDPMCYEKPIPSDPCCVMVRCTESKALEDGEEEDSPNKPGECPEIVEESLSSAKACLSDCDHDGDCGGRMKCCPSSCGGAVCVQPIVVGNICENIYCGPNAKCNADSMTCECMEGYEGQPHDFLNGCKQSMVSKSRAENGTVVETSSPIELPSESTTSPTPPAVGTTTTTAAAQTTTAEQMSSKSPEEKSTSPTTEPPFELDLASVTPPAPTFEEDSGENNSLTGGPEPPSVEGTYNDTDGRSRESNRELEDEDFNTTYEDDKKENKKKQPSGVPIPFDGCEFNNITYDRGVRFDDGCEARCICDGPGHVTCVPRCSVLSSGGKDCREVPDPDDACCKIMVCSFPGNEMGNVDELSLKILSAQPQNGTAVRIRLALGSPGLPTMVGQDSLEVWYAMSNAGESNLAQWNKRPIMLKELTEVQQGIYEFDVNDLMPDKDYFFKVAKEEQGSTKLHMAEFSNTVNAKTFPSAVKSAFQGCFHHNMSYNLGEVFYQGCEFKCICRENGYIECQDRCEIYIDTVGYENCEWIPSEEDSCCMVPSCQRRKIPLMPGSRLPPFVGPVENMCVVNSNEFYRVGDIWEIDDGCKMKICRCALLPNGTTTIQCQSECPALPPNSHIPTARCPNPVLLKPDGPCSCPYISCNEPPQRRVVQPPRPQCEFKGKRYDVGEEFHDGCIALCHCSQDLRVSCAAIECPYHFSSEFTNCLEWDIDPDFFPTPPKCCAPSKCKNDGSCIFSGRKFLNFADIPADLLPCGARCVCVNGNVTCENRCPSVEDVPPSNLPCQPSLAYKGHPPGESCCLRWMCKEIQKQAYCLFQGSRYALSEQWEVRKASTRRLCSCQMDSSGMPQVECKGGCPQIPQRFVLPSEQCARPVIVTPDDPVMCPYVVCNNSVTAQELYNVNVVALNSTAVRIRFTLANILVGLVGHAELHFTTDPTLPPNEWHVQKFSRPKRLFDSPNIEYILNALRPNTTYFLQVKIKIDALQGGPESELFKLKMPEEVMPTSTTTTVPPVIMLDSKPEIHVIDANTARVSWRNFEPQEKKFIYGVQLKYKKAFEGSDKWITTPMIHRDVTSYFLHDLEPSTLYTVDMIFTPPQEVPTKLVSVKSLEFQTMTKPKEDYDLHVSVDENKIDSESTEFSLDGIPQPISKFVHVVKITYKTPDGKQLYSFKVPNTNKIELEHLEPGKKYLAQMELYLTNGHTLTSNEVEFITKDAKPELASSREEVNTIEGSHTNGHTNGKQAEPLQSKETKDNENSAYFIALVVVAVVAAVAGFGFVLLLVILVRRQASAKAPISRTPSESAYDNPTYKTYDGERLEDKNGQAIQTTQA